MGVEREGLVLAAVPLLEVGDAGEVGEALSDVGAGLDPGEQRWPRVLVDGGQGFSPLGSVVGTHLAADWDVLVVLDPHLLAVGAEVRSASVHVGQGDLVRALGVEPFADEPTVVVAVQAADSGAGRRVDGGLSGHGSSFSRVTG